MQGNESSQYRYFVSFAHRGGFGSIDITGPEPITSYEHIIAIKQHLDDWMNDDVIVLNFQPLSGPTVVDRSDEPRVNESFTQV